MKTIYLVRHAQTGANLGQPISSRDGVPLTGQGIQMSEVFAETFPATPDLLITSNTERTRATVRPLRERFPLARYETWAVHEFNWMAPERFSGLIDETLIPLAEAYWARAKPDEVDGEGAESFAAFLERLKATTNQVAQESAETIVLLSHGLFIRAMLWYILTGQPAPTSTAMASLHHFVLSVTVPNLGVIRIEITHAGEWRFSPILTTLL
jgi:probable phosphoglycerate mutase